MKRLIHRQFNIADLVLLKGVFQAARELNVPVMVGASEGEREFAGTRQLASVVRSLREEAVRRKCQLDQEGRRGAQIYEPYCGGRGRNWGHR